MSSVDCSLDRPATSVSQTRASIPVALRTARISLRKVGFGQLGSQGGEGFFDPTDGASLSQEPGCVLPGVRFKREPQHRALLGFGIGDQAGERRDDGVEAFAWIIGSIGREQRGRLRFRMGRHEQRALVREGVP